MNEVTCITNVSNNKSISTQMSKSKSVNNDLFSQILQNCNVNEESKTELTQDNKEDSTQQDNNSDIPLESLVLADVTNCFANIHGVQQQVNPAGDFVKSLDLKTAANMTQLSSELPYITQTQQTGELNSLGKAFDINLNAVQNPEPVSVFETDTVYVKTEVKENNELQVKLDQTLETKTEISQNFIKQSQLAISPGQRSFVESAAQNLKPEMTEPNSPSVNGNGALDNDKQEFISYNSMQQTRLINTGNLTGLQQQNKITDRFISNETGDPVFNMSDIKTAKGPAVPESGNFSQSNFKFSSETGAEVESSQVAESKVPKEQPNVMLDQNSFKVFSGRENEITGSIKQTDVTSQLTRRFETAIENQEKSFTMQLKPDNLGELTVTLNLNADKINIIIQAQSEKTKMLLQEQLTSLKSSLDSMNVKFDNLQVQVKSDVTPHFTMQNGYSGQSHESLKHHYSSGQSYDLSKEEAKQPVFINKYVSQNKIYCLA